MIVADVGQLIVGRVMKAHGIRGEVSVEVHSDLPDRFAPGAQVLVGEMLMVVATSRPHQGRMLIRFEGIEDRNASEALHGRTITVSEAEAAELDEHTYFPHQLEGLSVRDVAGNELGTFADVEESPAHDLWVVATATGTVYVPAVEQIVVSVDLDTGVITLDPPDGLF